MGWKNQATVKSRKVNSKDVELSFSLTLSLCAVNVIILCVRKSQHPSINARKLHKKKWMRSFAFCSNKHGSRKTKGTFIHKKMNNLP